MRLIIVNDYNEMSWKAASLVGSQIILKPDSILGLATGDTYFKVHRENHNLDRARTQFKMVEDMEGKFSEMKAIVQKHSALQYPNSYGLNK